MKKFMILLILVPSFSWAKDFGVQGPTFEILEPSLLERIYKKLSQIQESGKLQALQKEISLKARERARHPSPVQGLKTSDTPRSWHYDPTLTLQKDLYDHQGKLIAKAGMQINPLDYVSFGTPLLLIDGTKQEQIHWATRQEGMIVLTNGSPFELMETSTHSQTKRVYFDQQGRICRRFEVTSVPARISQDGGHLLIEEIPLFQGDVS